MVLLDDREKRGDLQTPYLTPKVWCGQLFVPLLSALVELTGSAQQCRDARDAVRPVQCNLKRPDRVSGELVSKGEVHDFHVVPLGIELLDLLEDIKPSRVGFTRTSRF